MSLTIPPHFLYTIGDLNPQIFNHQAAVKPHFKGQTLHLLCTIPVILYSKFIVKPHQAALGVGPLTVTWKLSLWAHTILV